MRNKGEFSMIKNENTSKTTIELSAAGESEIIDLPEEMRSGVMKITKPSKHQIALCKLSKFKDHIVNLKFSADVKRVGAVGDLRWQVSVPGYPEVGNAIENAETEMWHSMSGEWTGTLIGSRYFYLTVYNSNSDGTTYYIDNFNFEITSMGKRKIALSPELHKPLKDMAVYLKGLLPASIPEAYPLKPIFKTISSDENIYNGVVAYRDFLYLLCDRLIADGDLYDKPPKNNDSHANVTILYPFLQNIKNVLFNIGFNSNMTTDGDSLSLNKWQSLIDTVSAEGGTSAAKLSAPKIIEVLRFLEDCGFCFDGIDLDAEKPNLQKIETLTITYPDNQVMLTGLKIMAMAQREFGIKWNEEIFLRCDYRVLTDEESNITSLMNDYMRPLPENVRDFAIKLHKRYLDAGLTCMPKISLSPNFTYLLRNKEIWSFYMSPIFGYRLLIKPQNIEKYTDVINSFSVPLQEKIAKGYGCEKKRLGEPCQKGCHGFSFLLDDAIFNIAEDIETWIDNELTYLKRK
jgi:hypothetical protein